MGIREAHPLAGELVKIRSGDFASFRIVAMNIAVPEIIREDDDDVWLIDWSGS